MFRTRQADGRLARAIPARYGRRRLAARKPASATAVGTTKIVPLVR